MPRNNAINTDLTRNADGYTLTGGTTERSLTLTGGDVVITGNGSGATITFPSSTATLATLDLSETLQNKTLATPGVTGDIVFTERADHASTPGAGFGYLWVKNTNPSSIVFTDDAGNDTTLGAGGGGGFTSFDLAADSGTAETVDSGETVSILGGTGITTIVSATNTVTIAIDGSVATLSGTQTLSNKTLATPQVTGDVVLAERADHASTPGAGFGYLWVKDTTPSTLVFTDDAGNDTTLGSGSGDVVGPASSTDNAIARFDSTTGKLVQNSSVILDDNGRIRLGGADGSAMVDVIGATAAGIQGLRIQGDAAGAISFSTYISGDSFLRFNFTAAGVLLFGDGTAPGDTNLYRSGANTLTTDDSFSAANVDTGIISYAAARGKVTAGGNLGATETINFNSETNYTGTLDSNITFTFANATSGDEITLFLSYDGSAQRTITWPTVTWLDNSSGAAPTTPAASGNVLVVTVRYIGTTYYASATGNYAVYS